MKTNYFIGAALVAALHCATINAQVIGGNAVGGLGGSLGGNMSRGGIDVIGQGSGRGSLGTDLDSGSLRRTSGDLARHH